MIHDRKVYFQSFTALFVYDGKKIRHISPGGTVVLLIKAADRLFIHRIGQGLFEIIDQELVFVEGSGFLSDDEVKMVVPLGQNRYLVGAARKGLFVYNGKSFKPWAIDAAEEIRKAEINCGLKLEDKIAIGTIVKGIYILNQKGKVHYHLNTENSLQNNTVLSLARDSSNNLWAGLDKGIDYIDFNPPMDFYIDQTGALGAVYAATMFRNQLWIGTNRGLYKYRRRSGNRFTDPVMIDGSQGQVWSLDVFDDQLFCGHNNGTFRIMQDNELERISTVNGGFHISKVTINEQEILLQSTYANLVIYKKMNGVWQFSHTVDGFLEPVPDFQTDYKNNIWASHLNKGVFKLRLDEDLQSLQERQHFQSRHGLQRDRMVHVTKIDGRIVFSTGYQLFTYDDLNDTIVPYNTLNKQMGQFKEARKIIAAPENNYWFLSRDKIGLFKISAGSTHKLFNYNLHQQGLSMSSEYPEIIPLKEKMHLICFDNGFAIYNDPPRETLNTGKVLMRRVKAVTRHGEEKYLNINKEHPVSLRSDYRNITFRFSTTEKYVKPLYRYKLKGLDDDSFTTWQNTPEITFNRLPAGEYVFIAQSKNIYDKVSNTLTYSFRIRPPWYLSHKAIAFYVALLIALVFYLRYLFLSRLRKHARWLKQQEKQKREHEQMQAHQKVMKIHNEKLEAELRHKNVELANHTMNLVNKNDLLMTIKNDIRSLKKDLGPRFPNYHYRQLLKTINKNISSEDEWETFEAHFDQIHQNFFKRLMEKYPELTQSDLKMCAYLRMNLSTKEIAPLLNISIRGVEARRYRLRKRLNLDHDANLVEFLLQF
ncbi:MAG: triple tyrosine motif-containing protein [Bacteroidales bacterium]|nr:triple tyrosine motif-containing protein [Bacteroidales bacterium]